MENRKSDYMIRRIGSTNYRVKVGFSEEATETFEDKMIRLVSGRLIKLEDLFAKEGEPKGAA